MEILNPIYMALNITVLLKMTILNIHFALFYLMKRYGVNRMFSLVKRDISEWDSRYEPKNNQPADLNKACRQPPLPSPHVYQAPEVAVACAAHAIVAHEALFNLLTYLLRNILKITRIKLQCCSKLQYSTQPTYIIM